MNPALTADPRRGTRALGFQWVWVFGCAGPLDDAKESNVSCGGAFEQASAMLNVAVKDAQRDCSVDTDCVRVAVETACSGSSLYYLNRSAVTGFLKVVAQLKVGPCKAYAALGCPEVESEPLPTRWANACGAFVNPPRTHLITNSLRWRKAEIRAWFGSCLRTL